jgi:hypothetical protein
VLRAARAGAAEELREDGIRVARVEEVVLAVLVAPPPKLPRCARAGPAWLRARAAGKQQVREFELVGGRAHTGKCRIVSFDGNDNLWMRSVCFCIPLESFAC